MNPASDMFEVVLGGTSLAWMVTSNPRRCSCRAAVSPTAPQPITAARRLSCASAISAAMAPVPHESDIPAPPCP